MTKITETMSSSKPYLIRAIYDWLVDNQQTPYLSVNTQYPGVEIPAIHIEGNVIVLNVSPQACRGLHFDNDRIVFTTRFSGKSTQIAFPPEAVLAIFSNENAAGMEFNEEALPTGNLPQKPRGSLSTPRKRPTLTLVDKAHGDKENPDPES